MNSELQSSDFFLLTSASGLLSPDSCFLAPEFKISGVFPFVPLSLCPSVPLSLQDIIPITRPL